MPFVSIRLAGSASKEQKAGIVADVTSSLVARLGKVVTEFAGNAATQEGIMYAAIH